MQAGISASLKDRLIRLLILAFAACIIHIQTIAQFSFSDSAVKARIRHVIYVLASDSPEGAF